MAAAAPRRTKILATIGPASGSPERMAQLVAAGMDGARLNFSHGSHDQHRDRADAARAAAAEAEAQARRLARAAHADPW
jgi:pyruvate kinase